MNKSRDANRSGMTLWSRREGVTRRGFLKATSAAGLSACFVPIRPAHAGVTPTPTVQNPKPNILYILADDLGYGDVACMNPESKIPTPNMDRLAREGVFFSDAHSGSAVCTPTRYGILTGRYCWRTSLKASVLDGYSGALIKPQRLNVASLLKNYGYQTACVGKWHLGWTWATTDGKTPKPANVDYTKPLADGPNALGFDYFFGIPASLDMPPYVYVENDRVVEIPTGTIPASEKPEYYRAGPIAAGFKHDEVLPVLTRKALEFIEQSTLKHDPNPFFLFFSLNAPHTPIMPSGEFKARSGLGPYGDFVCQVDAAVGQIIDALDRLDIAQNTLIILTSDNGCSPMADFEALRAHGHDPSAHFRGHKADIFEGGHRIPFIARWPQTISPGTRSENTICLTDLIATAAEIVGANLPDNAAEDSFGMLDTLRHVNAPPRREATVHHSINGALSIRQGPWKLVFCPGSGGWSHPKPDEAKKLGLPPVQLYNLQDDPAETTNLKDQYPGVTLRLTQLMEKYIREGRSTPGAPQKNEGRDQTLPGMKQ